MYGTIFKEANKWCGKKTTIFDKSISESFKANLPSYHNVHAL